MIGTRTSILLTAAALLLSNFASAQTTKSVLFIGNSFTFGAGSPVQFYRADSVTDLNAQGIGGIPALFKAFAAQAGLDYEVSLETQGGAGLDWHLANKLDVITSKRWDMVVMHGHSMLDLDKPGDPTKLVATAKQMAEELVSHNAGVNIYLTSTWSRADQTYPATGVWTNQPIEAMTRDIRAGYDQAAHTSSAVKAVVPVGEAWIRAMHAGIADPNPYDGVAFGQLDLWTYDHYHASAYGYYLEALVVFGTVTGLDPRSLGDTECTALELGLSRKQAHDLQQVAFDELEHNKLVTMTVSAPAASGTALAKRCVSVK